MGTQLNMALGDIRSEYQRLKVVRAEMTAAERNQSETVATLAGMLRQERKTLRQAQKQKRMAEDEAELFRAAHDLEI
jgi:hypothetical protein